MTITRTTLSLWLVKIPGRRRAHMVAQITNGGLSPIWQAETTVCGLRNFENYGLEWKTYCRQCHYGPGEPDPWSDAPPDLLESIRARVRDKIGDVC